MFQSTGQFLEMLMSNLLGVLGINMPQDTGVRKEELINNLPSWRKRAVETGYKDQFNRTLVWEKKSSKWILDKAYKVDKLLEVKPGVFYGFDFTVDPDSVDKKLKDIKDLMPYITKTGVSNMAVVLCILDNSGLGVYSEQRAEEIEESLWEIFEEMDSQSLSFFTIDLRHNPK